MSAIAVASPHPVTAPLDRSAAVARADSRPPVPVSASPRRLGQRPVLDGLRGIAILLVMLTHTGVLPNGYVGVDLFFALSGFLITTLLYEEWDRAGTISLTRFYKRRARRLLPALGVMIAIGLIVDLVVYPMTGWSFGIKALTSSLFVNNWVAAAGHAKQLGSLNPTWSLAQEEQFYLLWPLLLMLMLRRRMRPELVAAVLVAIIVPLVIFAPGTGSNAHAYQVYYSPFTRAAELLFGCLGAVVWRHKLADLPGRQLRKLGLHTPAWLARSSVMPGWAVPTWAAVRQATAGSRRGATLWRTLLACALAYMFGRLLFNYQATTEQIYLRACLIAVPMIMTLLSAPTSWISRLIAVAPLRFLGRISYSLYLYHLLLRDVVYHLVPHASLDVKALVTIVSSIALASLSWRLIESKVLARPLRPVTQRSSVPVRPRVAPRPHAKPGVLAGERRVLA